MRRLPLRPYGDQRTGVKGGVASDLPSGYAENEEAGGGTVSKWQLPDAIRLPIGMPMSIVPQKLTLAWTWATLDAATCDGQSLNGSLVTRTLPSGNYTTCQTSDDVESRYGTTTIRGFALWQETLRTAPRQILTPAIYGADNAIGRGVKTGYKPPGAVPIAPAPCARLAPTFKADEP